MISKFYLPIIKSKQGEFDALSILNPDVKGLVMPLVEVAKMEFDNAENAKPKTIEKHLENICKRISTKWGRSNAFIDTYLVNDTLPDGKNCIEYMYERFAQQGAGIPSLVIQFLTPDNILAACNEAMKKYNLPEAAIRLTVADMVSLDLLEELKILLQKIVKDSKNCHLVLDLNGADFSNTSDFSDTLVDLFRDFPFFQEWKSVTVCGGSFPKTNLLKQGVNEIPRGEWALYNQLVEKLKNKDFERQINYGDYGIVAPGHFEYDPLKMDRSANIRYTHNNSWYVVKGKSLKLEGHAQYFDLAKNIVTESGYFFGENFSAGDLHLKKCSDGQTTSGNPTVWNKIGFNHHFTKVLKDLNASYFAA
ncbi:MAG: beta family protein [Chitinophagaceae bacterium]|nr:beta family protein [Chitinophagaceae bacterium]